MEILVECHHVLCMQFFPEGYWKKDNSNHILTTFLLTSMRGNLEHFERGESRAIPDNFPMLGPKKSGD